MGIVYCTRVLGFATTYRPLPNFCYHYLMKVYISKYNPLPGTSHASVFRSARYEYHKIQKLTPRRQPYVRSRYFSKDKVFVNSFWEHLRQKHPGDQLRRAKLFLCAIDLIRNTKHWPEIVTDKTSGTQLYRFFGKTNEGQIFCVQIKHNIKTDRKDFMSVFPANKRP